MFNWRKKKTSYWSAQRVNDVTYIDLLDRITELALNMFEYKNLPLTVDPRWMELQLFSKGYALYFNDDIIGNLCLACTLGGEMNLYNVPTERTVVTSTEYYAVRDFTNSVIIYNNYLRTPGITQAELFAYRLYMIQRTIDVNVNAQKMPFIIKTKNEQRLTKKNIVKDINGNELYVYVDKDFDMQDLQVTPTPAPFTADKLRTLYHDVWNEVLTFYGYENSNQNKKERSVEAEVTSEYGWIEAQRNVWLKARQDAFRQINDMFGTDIQVGFRSDLPSLLNRSNLQEQLDQIGLKIVPKEDPGNITLNTKIKEGDNNE